MRKEGIESGNRVGRSPKSWEVSATQVQFLHSQSYLPYPASSFLGPVAWIWSVRLALPNNYSKRTSRRKRDHLWIHHHRHLDPYRLLLASHPRFQSLNFLSTVDRLYYWGRILFPLKSRKSQRRGASSMRNKDVHKSLETERWRIGLVDSSLIREVLDLNRNSSCWSWEKCHPKRIWWGCRKKPKEAFGRDSLDGWSRWGGKSLPELGRCLWERDRMEKGWNGKLINCVWEGRTNLPISIKTMDLTIVLFGSTRFPTKPFFPAWSNVNVTDVDSIEVWGADPRNDCSILLYSTVTWTATDFYSTHRFRRWSSPNNRLDYCWTAWLDCSYPTDR